MSISLGSARLRYPSQAVACAFIAKLHPRCRFLDIWTVYESVYECKAASVSNSLLQKLFFKELDHLSLKKYGCR